MICTENTHGCITMGYICIDNTHGHNGLHLYRQQHTVTMGYICIDNTHGHNGLHLYRQHTRSMSVCLRVIINRFVPLVPTRVVRGSTTAWAGFQGVKNLTCYCLWDRDVKWGLSLCGAYLTGTVENHHWCLHIPLGMSATLVVLLKC